MVRPGVFLTRMLSLICPLLNASTHKILGWTGTCRFGLPRLGCFRRLSTESHIDHSELLGYTDWDYWGPLVVVVLHCVVCLLVTNIVLVASGRRNAAAESWVVWLWRSVRSLIPR